MSATSALGFYLGIISSSFAIKGGDSAQVAALCFDTCNDASITSLLQLSFWVLWWASMMMGTWFLLSEIIYLISWWASSSLCCFPVPTSLFVVGLCGSAPCLHSSLLLSSCCLFGWQPVCLPVFFLLPEATSCWGGRGSLTEGTGVPPVSIVVGPGTPLGSGVSPLVRGTRHSAPRSPCLRHRW